jgi:hypothetical protein
MPPVSVEQRNVVAMCLVAGIDVVCAAAWARMSPTTARKIAREDGYSWAVPPVYPRTKLTPWDKRLVKNALLRNPVCAQVAKKLGIPIYHVRKCREEQLARKARTQKEVPGGMEA